MTWWWWQRHQENDDTKGLTLPSSPRLPSHINANSEIPSKESKNISHNKIEDAALGRDEQAYQDLKVLLSTMNPDAAETAMSRVEKTTKEQPRDNANSIYPSTMSCSNCFDQAFYCSSAVGQLNNIYRYGGLRSCSELWAQWRFCMRTKAMSDEMRNAEIRRFNIEKAAKYKLGPSSEDVWETRKELAENAFTKDF